MRAANDVIISGAAFADAVRHILGRSRVKDLGDVVLRPGAAGTIEMEAFYASATVEAEGNWADIVTISGRFLRNFVVGNPPATFRLVFFDSVLAVNGTSISASALPPDHLAREPAYKPTNRLGVPLARTVNPYSRR